MRARVVVGTGRYADPWHPFADVGERVGGLLADDGWTVEVDDEVDGAMARLGGVDLLVVAAGDPWGQGDHGFGAPPASVAGLAAAASRGIGVVGLHAAAASLRDYPDWAALLGGVWVPGASMHPELGPTEVRLAEHALTAGLGRLAVVDERYSFLQPVGDRTVLATHVHDDVVHPLVWVREHGPARVAYDALGHDLRSYESAEHVTLLRRLARWAARA